MKTSVMVISIVLLAAVAGPAGAQVAGSTRLGVTVEQTSAIAVGWSAKKQVLGQPVYNEQNQRVGIIDDLVIAPGSAVSFVIIGAGGFVGLGRHDVLIPVEQLTPAQPRKRSRPCRNSNTRRSNVSGFA